MKNCKLVGIESVVHKRSTANEITVRVGDIERCGILASNCTPPFFDSRLTTDGAFLYDNTVAIARLYPETPSS